MVAGGVNVVPVTLDTNSGSATLVYQIDRTGNTLSVSSVGITSPGQNTVSNNLVAGTPVEVFGVPQTNGSIKAYVLFYYTGIKPTRFRHRCVPLK